VNRCQISHTLSKVKELYGDFWLIHFVIGEVDIAEAPFAKFATYFIVLHADFEIEWVSYREVESLLIAEKRHQIVVKEFNAHLAEES